MFAENFTCKERAANFVRYISIFDNPVQQKMHKNEILVFQVLNTSRIMITKLLHVTICRNLHNFQKFEVVESYFSEFYTQRTYL